MEQGLAFLIELFAGKGLGERKQFQCVGQAFLGHVTESGKSAMTLSISHGLPERR
jgi:hypothetical protein